MHTTLLTTKFHTPRPTPNLVARLQLTQRLVEGPDKIAERGRQMTLDHEPEM